MQTMLRDMGQFGQNHELAVKELADEKWKQSAKQVLDTLLKGSPADFTQPFDELVDRARRHPVVSAVRGVAGDGRTGSRSR